MSADNIWVLTGNLTRDVETRQVGESVVAKFSIAYNSVWKKDGEKKERVSYFDIEIWGAQAEIAAKFLEKGSQVTVMGEAIQDIWEKDGEKRSKVFMKASDLRLRGAKKSKDEKEVKEQETTTSGVPF